ncbi:MAG: hypothetical protein K2P84_03995, partial [Undibacterium sp.]|nr:hypothetical protein [Undibacterium sp.]
MSDQKVSKAAAQTRSQLAQPSPNGVKASPDQDAGKADIAPEPSQIPVASISEAPPLLAAEKARSMIEHIKGEADALSAEQRAHLNSHIIANTLHETNERCFVDVNVFRQMTITFYGLRANSKAFLSIAPDQLAIWSEGGAGSRMVGLSFTAVTQPTLYLRNFLINAREM